MFTAMLEGVIVIVTVTVTVVVTATVVATATAIVIVTATAIVTVVATEIGIEAVTETVIGADRAEMSRRDETQPQQELGCTFCARKSLLYSQNIWTSTPINCLSLFLQVVQPTLTSLGTHHGALYVCATVLAAL